MESPVSRGPDIYKKSCSLGHNTTASAQPGLLNFEFVAAVTTDKLFHNSHLTDKEKEWRGGQYM